MFPAGFSWTCSGAGHDFAQAQQLFLSGQYDACVAAVRAAAPSYDADPWRVLESKALAARGQYPEALKAATNALARERDSVWLMWQAREALLSNGEIKPAGQMAERIIREVSAHPRDHRDAISLTVFGEAALLQGADPKRVLDTVYQSAKKADPKEREVYLAGGGLALREHDFDLAAKTFTEGLKQLPGDPDLELGLAKAYAPSDQALMMASLEAALEKNSNHVGSLLLLVDHSIDAEDYAQAAKLLARITAVNPWDPDAWAYRAVIAQLQNKPEAEEKARETALKFWPTNPRVDFLIGQKLSQNYRFAEGSSHQRQALLFDPDYLPAKGQLAQDLLRLGDENAGWRVADEVQKEDGYDVQAFNLATLHDTMAGFTSLTNGRFVLRMAPREAEIYGSRALALLDRAKTRLCAKYGLDLEEPTIVEVFPEQKDFAVRTFGMPGNPGYLGVCFGSVITANSPAAHVGHAVNWESVLWHEFCHVVTLHLTKNKMPRWLSEGISVYEERQANPAWGQRMNPEYRGLVLGGDLTPVSKLSAAFLAPRSNMYLQFAYYESSLVVEFLVKQFGIEALKATLRDLGNGVEINQALVNHTLPIKELDDAFAKFAHERAEQLAPGLDFEKPDSERKEATGSHGGSRRGAAPTPRRWIDSQPAASWEAWAKDHPTNFWVMSRQAEQLVEDQQWQEAEPVLKRLVDLYPSQTGPDSAYRMLAETQRALGKTNEERQVLAQFAEKDSEAPDVYLRLMELATATRDWTVVITNAQRYLAVDPLVAAPYRFLGRAADETGQTDIAIGAYRALLRLDPPDPTQVHFVLAKALRRKGDPGARRQVLEALEEAPRFRAALRMLLELDGGLPTRAENTGDRTAHRPGLE